MIDPVPSLTSHWRAALAGAAVAAIAGCSTNELARTPAFDPQFARALNETATQAAVAKPGTKVCRTMQVGIAERDWIRGVVAEAGNGRIEVRIDDAGRFPHVLDGVPVTRGALVHGSPIAWIPCL